MMISNKTDTQEVATTSIREKASLSPAREALFAAVVGEIVVVGLLLQSVVSVGTSEQEVESHLF